MSNEQGEQLPGGRGTITVVEIAGPPPNHLDVIARRKADQRASMARGRAAAALAKQRNDWWRCPNGHSASGNLCALCDATRAEAVPVRVAPDEIPVEGLIVPVIADASLRPGEFRLVQMPYIPSCIDPLDRLVGNPLRSVRECLIEFSAAQREDRPHTLDNVQRAAAGWAWADQLRTTKRKHQERERMRVVLDNPEDY